MNRIVISRGRRAKGGEKKRALTDYTDYTDKIDNRYGMNRILGI